MQPDAHEGTAAVKKDNFGSDVRAKQLQVLENQQIYAASEV